MHDDDLTPSHAQCVAVVDAIERLHDTDLEL